MNDILPLSDALLCELGKRILQMERGKSICYSPDCLGKVVTALGAPSPDYDLYTVINTIVEGIVNDRVLVTEDSATVLLEGNSTSSSPLVASFAPDAITSSDGTVVVVQEADGTFDLSATAPVADLTSPDNSIDIIPPANPGDPTGIELATTFTGSPSIDVTYTPGAPPDYSFALSPTALIPSPNPALTPVSTVFSGGQFQLGVALGIIPRTVIVGGQIGSTPSSPTMSGAIALLPLVIPVDEPWTLLFLPGNYSEPGPVVVPLNVNLVGLIPGSVSIESGVSYIDLARATDAAVVIDSLIFRDALTLQLAPLGAATIQVKVSNSRFALGTDPNAVVLARMSAPDASSKIVFKGCKFETTTRSLVIRGIVTLKSCNLTCNLNNQAQITSTQYEFFNCKLTPSSAIIDGSNNLTLRAYWTTLGGSWTLLGVGYVPRFFSCHALQDWTIDGTLIFQDSRVVNTVSRVGTSNTFNVQSPNFASAVAVDRPVEATLGPIDLTSGSATVTVNFDPPLYTTYNSIVGIPTTTLEVTSNAADTRVAAIFSPAFVDVVINGTGTLNQVWLRVLPPAVA